MLTTCIVHGLADKGHFGITLGRIDHIDDNFVFSDRLPYTTAVQGLYYASAGTHPAGLILGYDGQNAAIRLLKDIGIR